MKDAQLAELLKTQKSLTEWLEDIKHKDAQIMRREDSEKHGRLSRLKDIIDLPFNQPTRFEANDLANKTRGFSDYLKKNAKEVCALRLTPKEDGLPKLRMRGKSVEGAYEWFLEQDIDPTKYKADFIPHEKYPTWATIFVVNDHGIQGEIVRGMHYQLTQGIHEEEPPMIFKYDFKEWMLYPDNQEALQHLKKIAKNLKVPDASKRKKLEQELKATFIKNYLKGYFETMDSLDCGTWFIDYSPTLGKIYGDMSIKAPSTQTSGVSGLTGSPGKAKGKVKIVHPDNLDVDFPKGSVLVCEVTTPLYVPLMEKAAAIVTDQGGILSHAAIVARELKKPCIVGTGNATKKLKDGQTIAIDADNGTVSVNS